MTAQRHKTIGYTLIGFSAALIILLALVKINVDNEQALLCELVHTTPNTDMGSCPAHQSSTSWLLFIAFGISALILGGGIYLLFAHKKEHHDYRDVDVSTLSEEERRLCALLKEHDGAMYQSDLIKQTGHSKVQMTRLIDKLAAKNIVERKRRGMTNIIVLK